MTPNYSIHGLTAEQLTKVQGVLGVAPGKTTGKGKTAKAADDDFDLGDDDTGGDDDAGGDDEITREQVIKAFKKHAEENDRASAMKVLKKFKVKSVHDIDEDDFAKVLKALKA